MMATSFPTSCGDERTQQQYTVSDNCDLNANGHREEALSALKTTTTSLILCFRTQSTMPQRRTMVVVI
jgi:hypothetical protein